ncbi:multidrug resistance-associated ABC transporter [Cristinia sonorae]|uniref:Multidrug resistance-associated ABC transporter n=1 Tax=Cristinia sonorae TaxID=1940300 RepID=A0A8K0UV95_9AGAR|nr:multidrug resistance-associated ABC transporter [Cristinia sonorae]
MYNPLHPPPAPPAFGEDKVVAEESSSFFSKLIFSWLDSFLQVGFSRPLEKEDLWQLPSRNLTDSLSSTLEANFYERCPPEKRPAFLRNNDASSTSAVTAPTASGKKTTQSEAEEKESNTRTAHSSQEKKSPQHDSSLIKALHKTFFYRWWFAGLLKLISDTLKTTSPLVTKVLLTWLTESYAYYHASEEQRAQLGFARPRGIGYGIGIAFALFAMQEISSLMTNHYMLISMGLGMSVRTSVIGSIFRKALRLSGRARLDHSVGQITTMISTDASRLDRCAWQAHNLWVAPVQIIIGVALLIANLGYSALVGLGVLLFGFPIQFFLVKLIFGQRKKGVKFTDQRVRLLTEVLQGIRLIKYYAWELFYSHQIGEFRKKELKTVRKIALSRSLLIASMFAVPVIAAVLSFITYSLSGHELDVAIIFTSLQYFNIIRIPLVFLPLVIASVTDAIVALGRISKFLMAEEIAEPYLIEPENKLAVDVDADFQWETAYKGNTDGPKFDVKGKKDGHKPASEKAVTPVKKWGWSGRRKAQAPVLPVAQGLTEKDGESTAPPSKRGSIAKSIDKFDDKPFELPGLQFKIAKGAFVAIVGRVGSGKSSLLQALIGEMRRTRGSVVFSSSIAYVPQSAWIMNATLRDNILFGREENNARFREVVEACCLEHDLEMLPHGENTEIGEKGINLSGGQKARVSLARAAYSGADIILMDDSLSAVDAYVGKKILDECLLSGPLAGKTRILATHSLHVLDKTDYIYVMDHGRIVAEGTYSDLLVDSPIFSRIMEEYGTMDKAEDADQVKGEKIEDPKAAKEGKDAQKPQAGLMQAEERVIGSVSGDIYLKYFRYAGGVILIPFLVLLVALYQGSQVANTLFLGFWTSSKIHGFKQGDYMATYAALGIASGIFAFLMGFSVSVLCLVASLGMFKDGLTGVLRSPVSFFDTTPMGRIMSRLSKDQDTLDTEIAQTAFTLLANSSTVLGTAGLIFYTFPYLGIAFVPLSILYYGAAIYYRRTSIETKRLDSLMRSALYSSYSESLTGLSTIRGYAEQKRFIRRSEQGLDMENRAYYMTIAIQQWLGARLDVLGNVLVLGIALFGAGFRKTVDPSNVGVVLTYTLSIVQVFSQLVSAYAQNEQNFNAVERVLYYTELTPEGDTTKPDDPPPSWPANGAISFNMVEMAYREGLPLVLKGVTFDVKPGEKVGIVGRTGAGKSSLLQALFRVVNLQGGSIVIDGQNIAEIGLATLRSRLALVPQDSTLFLGTLRENLDPQGTRTDAEIISALQRAWLLPRDGAPADPQAEAKFNLNASVNDEGSNYSAGEKQLLALCRALVKGSKIIILDEATSNVDVETDAKLQRTIQTEFASSTLLCIAHRLNTIVYYDRIIAMDNGEVAEFDTPLNLFDKEDSIFRSLCDEAGLSRQDIVRIRSGAVSQITTEMAV